MKKGFNSKPHLICCTDNIRTHMNHIWFNNGYLHATDGHAAIKQHLSLHEFSEDEIKMMQDKWMHRSIFPDIYKAEYLKVHEKGIVGVSKTGHETLFTWANVSDRFPDLDYILTQEMEETPLPSWAINPTLLKRVYDAMVMNFDSGVKLTFTGARRKIIVEPVDYSELQIAIIMPVEVNDNWITKRGISHPMLQKLQKA